MPWICEGTESPPPITLHGIQDINIFIQVFHTSKIQFLQHFYNIIIIYFCLFFFTFVFTFSVYQHFKPFSDKGEQR